MEMEMEVDPIPPSWFEFLLDRNLLERHLSSANPDPTAATLLILFVINAEKAAGEAGGGGVIPTPISLPASGEGDDLEALQAALTISYKHKKSKALKLVALQTLAFLYWDLEELGKIHISTQHTFMKQLLKVVDDEKEDKDQEEEWYSSKEFLKVLYHRWVLRTFQGHNAFTKSRYGQPPEQAIALENVWKELNVEESLNYMKGCLTNPNIQGCSVVIIPTLRTFSVENKPLWSLGTEIEKTSFLSMINLELGIFLLHKGNTVEAMTHFENQQIPTENFPYLKISRNKLEGYLRAVGILKTFDQQLEDNKVVPKSLEHARIMDLSLSLRKGSSAKLKKILNVNVDLSDKGQDRLKLEDRDTEDGTYLFPGDDKLPLFTLEKQLIETTDVKEIEKCISKLHTAYSAPHQPSTKSLSTLFNGWELPIPVQHAVRNLTGAGSGGSAFQDHIHILVAKSRQLLNCKEYGEARKMLLTAKTKLQQKFQQCYAGGVVNPFVLNLDKLIIMMDWEILLLDINEFVTNYPDGLNQEDSIRLKNRCRECLERLQDPKTEINPRSEIVENILITFINLGEYSYVLNFDKSHNQRWPFVEFIGLLARVCHDLFLERKETSSSYREFWTAVLPIFCNNGGGNTTSGMKKQGLGGMSSKPSMLSSRSSLAWVIERSCSHALLSVWVSLLARLHNHILDDIGLQIHSDFLHIWPNILDDVTSSSVIPELKSNRVSGSSKLNSKQIRDFLFSILEKAIKISRNDEGGPWLRCLGDVYLASGSPSLAMKCYIEFLAMGTDFFETAVAPHWNDSRLFKRMIKCCEMLGCFTQAVVLCQFLSPEVDYSMAFGMAQEKTTNDSSDSLYGFIWDLTVLEFLINLHTKRNETAKRQQAVKVMGLLELNSNNNDEIQREAMCLRRAQFMRTLAKHYIFV